MSYIKYMDTKTVGMAVSVSAIGAALAYLGLTNYNDDSVLKKNEPIDVTENINNYIETDTGKDFDKEVNKDINGDISKDVDLTSANVITKEFASEEELKNDEDKIKDEVKNVIQKEAWGKFWKSEYESVDKNGTINPGINADGFQ